MAQRKKRADHRVQDATKLREEAFVRKEKREQRKLLERLGTVFCDLCKVNHATPWTDRFGFTSNNTCDSCRTKLGIDAVNKKFQIVPAIKVNLGDKLIAAFKK